MLLQLYICPACLQVALSSCQMHAGTTAMVVAASSRFLATITPAVMMSLCLHGMTSMEYANCCVLMRRWAVACFSVCVAHYRQAWQLVTQATRNSDPRGMPAHRYHAAARAAISALAVQAGQGRAVLTGTHPELHPDWLAGAAHAEERAATGVHCLHHSLLASTTTAPVSACFI